MPGDRRQVAEREATEMFEPPSWDDRYAGEEKIWSGNPNAQLVAEVAGLTAGAALDVGCGEGGDVIWLARQVTTHFLHPRALTRDTRLDELGA